LLASYKCEQQNINWAMQKIIYFFGEFIDDFEEQQKLIEKVILCLPHLFLKLDS